MYRRAAASRRVRQHPDPHRTARPRPAPPLRQPRIRRASPASPTTRSWAARCRKCSAEDAFAPFDPQGDRALAGETVPWEGWLEYRQGRALRAAHLCAAATMPTGAIDGYFIFTRDLTELKHSERQLAEQLAALQRQRGTQCRDHRLGARLHHRHRRDRRRGGVQSGGRADLRLSPGRGAGPPIGDADRAAGAAAAARRGLRPLSAHRRAARARPPDRDGGHARRRRACSRSSWPSPRCGLPIGACSPPICAT